MSECKDKDCKAHKPLRDAKLEGARMVVQEVESDEWADDNMKAAVRHAFAEVEAFLNA